MSEPILTRTEARIVTALLRARVLGEMAWDARWILLIGALICVGVQTIPGVGR